METLIERHVFNSLVYGFQNQFYSDLKFSKLIKHGLHTVEINFLPIFLYTQFSRLK